MTVAAVTASPILIVEDDADLREMMAQLQLAMMGQLPYTVLRDAIFAHPTLAEAWNNLFSTLDEQN